MGREIFVAIAYIIVGIVMIVSCSILIYIKRNKLLKWPITSGIVVDIIRKRRHTRRRPYSVYTAVVEFTVNNQYVVGDDGIYDKKVHFPHKIGDKVNILYDPANYQKFYVVNKRSKSRVYSMELTVLALGFLIFVIGFINLLAIKL